jgi:cell division protein FtsB
MRRFEAPVRVVVASIVVVGALFVFVFPTKAYLEQRSEIDGVRADLATLREQNERLVEEAARLSDPREIEQIARERFNLVRPGEQAFAVIPAPDGEAPTATLGAPAVTVAPSTPPGAPNPVGTD